MIPRRILLILIFSFLTLFFSMFLKSNRILSAMTQSKKSNSVIVVGSGLAGLAASSELVSRNIPVHILERQAKPGGNSIKASSGINGVPTRFQVPGSDSVSDFYNDTVKSVSPRLMDSLTETREALISTLTKNSASAVHWLVDEKGIDLSRVAQLGGHSRARTHRGAGPTPPGASIVLTLLKQLQESPLVKIETSTTVTKVLKTNDEIVGVEVSHGDGTAETVPGRVIFVSGGFAGDSNGLLAKYRPDLTSFPSTNEALPGSQNLLADIGAKLLDMDQVQVHPTGFLDPKDQFKRTKFLAAEVLRGEGGILLKGGKRFINELQTRKVIADAIISTPPQSTDPLKQWDIVLLMDEATYEATKTHVDFYIWKGLMRKTTIADLEHSDSALQTIKQYASTAQGSTPDTLGRTSFGHWSLRDPTPDTVVYVGTVTPVVHYTMGGVVFTPEAQVLNEDGQPFRGLWAAGEITGGIHGANRLGGSSLLECVVFGRIAGQNAARVLSEDAKGE